MEIAPHYSLVKEHEKHFELHDKRDNKKFVVPKKELHPATQIKIMKMPKFAEGGEVKDELPIPQDDSSAKAVENYVQPTEEQQLSDTINSQRGAIGSAVKGIGDVLFKPPAEWGQTASNDTVPVPNDAADVAPKEPAPQQQQQAPPQAQGQPMPSGMPTIGGLNALEAQQAQGINMQAQGQVEQNKQIAALQSQEVERQQKAVAESQARSQQWEQQLQQMSNDIASSKIDPQRYWNNKSNSSKAMTALGVILSGLGQGMSRSTHNMAWEALQNNINRDIESQKDELGKKQTLLSDNLRIHGEMMQAEAATRLQYSAIMQGQLAKIAAQTGNPMILGAAQQHIAQLKMQDIPLKQQLYQHELAQRMMQQSAGQPQGNGPIDEQRFNALKMSGMMPKEDAEAATKEANQLAEVRALRKDYDTTFNELNKKALAGALTPGQVDSAKWTIAGKLQHASAGRFNLEDAKKQVDAMFPAKFDLDSTRAFRREKSNALFDTMEAGTTTLDRYGLKRPYQAPHPNEGKIASNARGDKLIMQGGKWVPYRGR